MISITVSCEAEELLNLATLFKQVARLIRDKQGAGTDKDVEILRLREENRALSEEVRACRSDVRKLREAAKVERAMKLHFLTPKTIAAMIEAWNHCGNDTRKDLIDQAERELRAEGVIETLIS